MNGGPFPVIGAIGAVVQILIYGFERNPLVMSVMAALLLLAWTQEAWHGSAALAWALARHPVVLMRRYRAARRRARV